MGKRIPEVDDYIANAAPFARPILKHVRTLSHRALPKVEERTRWSAPWFDHEGQVFGMAAFKSHTALMFWRAKELPALEKWTSVAGNTVNLRRIQSLDDLPPDDMVIDMIRAAAALNATGPSKNAASKRVSKPPATVPDDLRVALDKNPAAEKSFEGFPPGQRREYIEWITEAKRDETRQRRLTQAIEWLAEGKRRNWKYENC